MSIDLHWASQVMDRLHHLNGHHPITRVDMHRHCDLILSARDRTQTITWKGATVCTIFPDESIVWGATSTKPSTSTTPTEP